MACSTAASHCFWGLAVAATATAAPASAFLGFDLYAGACRVDSSLISCAREFYPFTSALIFLGICVAVATTLVLRNRERF
jgi:hypothetical protein